MVYKPMAHRRGRADEDPPPPIAALPMWLLRLYGTLGVGLERPEPRDLSESLRPSLTAASTGDRSGQMVLKHYLCGEECVAGGFKGLCAGGEDVGSSEEDAHDQSDQLVRAKQGQGPQSASLGLWPERTQHLG